MHSNLPPETPATFYHNLPPSLSSSRYLSDEGIAELKGSAEKITHNDIIRIALDVSFNLVNI